MSWLQITLVSAPQDVSRVSRVLSENGALAVTLREGTRKPRLEPLPDINSLWRQTEVTGMFVGDADEGTLMTRLRTAMAPDPLPPSRVEYVENRNWEREWMSRFAPMRFGERLWICPSWSPVLTAGAICVLLDPGLAFGTGSHPSTGLCLEYLEAATLEGKKILDYGCGSGILAIAGLKLGATSAWGVDTDAQALVTSRENAEKNEVAGIFTALAPEELPTVQADVLVANILANPLVELSPHLATLVRPGGELVLAGVLSSQTEMVGGAYSEWFDMDPPYTRGEWARLTGRRK